MVQTSDPPSDERKRADFWRRGRRIRRNFVNRQTFMIAIRIIELVVRVAKVMNGLFGDL
ncbi:hypothetical protein [Methylosinus sp. KRF6]|uniref:hypothetical protein n=1 Tax=Methylosinus sp. KRF6 TaxID=2846853 RepID=UPI001C0CAB11|nr:hypothetical protein [Methylosinus sp. KRF6]MBU3890921.1 hypothetical protein [Methylosinus sp. KRF6]